MRPVLVCMAAIAMLGGCDTMQSMMGGGGPKATANLEPTKGSTVKGTVTFEQRSGKVHMVANVSGLRPNGEHGFHIHEAGDCSSGDGMSAKGHFNPHGKPHGDPKSPERHAGDLPMLKAGKDGRARLDVTVDAITLTPGPASIVGRGLIIHADPDDFKTQPTGNSGARIACGVIKAG